MDYLGHEIYLAGGYSCTHGIGRYQDSLRSIISSWYLLYLLIKREYIYKSNFIRQFINHWVESSKVENFHKTYLLLLNIHMLAYSNQQLSAKIFSTTIWNFVDRKLGKGRDFTTPKTARVRDTTQHHVAKLTSLT